MNEQFVYLKLVTGEQLMAYKESEDSSSITIKFPMLIKTHLIATSADRVSEQVTAGPYSLFLESPVVHLNKSHIVLDSKLHERAIVHYVGLVKNHEGVSLEHEAKALIWDDEERENFEAIPDISRAIEQLQAIAGEIEEEVEEGNKTFVEGNETLH
jgi:hypothetical protein